MVGGYQVTESVRSVKNDGNLYRKRLNDKYQAWQEEAWFTVTEETAFHSYTKIEINQWYGLLLYCTSKHTIIERP